MGSSRKLLIDFTTALLLKDGRRLAAVGSLVFMLSPLASSGLLVRGAFASDITFPNPEPVNVQNPHNFTDNRSANPLGFSPGDFLVVGVDFVTPITGVTGVATQGATTLPLVQTSTSPFGNFFSNIIPFNAALTGAWTVTLTDASGPVSAPTNAIPNPEVLPFVSNILTSGPSLTPHISWTLPDLTGLGVTGEQLRIFDLVTKINLDAFFFAPTTTSFDIPSGVLLPGKTYVFDVVLDNFVSPPAEFRFLQNRSETFANPYSTVPEASTLLLLGCGLAAVAGASAWRRSRRANYLRRYPAAAPCR